MEDLTLDTDNGDKIVLAGDLVITYAGSFCCIDLKVDSNDASAYDYINKDQAVLVIKHLTELFEIKNNSTDKLVAMVKELDAELAKGLNYIDSPRQAEVHHLINEAEGE